MKKLTRTLFVVAAVVFALATAAGIYRVAYRDAGMKPGNVMLHTQGSAMVAEETVPKGLPLTAEASCQVAGYNAGFAVDGDIETYWEGMGEYPQTLTLFLGEKMVVSQLQLYLNPIEAWGRRTMSFSVEASTDGEAFVETVPDTAYEFDWSAGNSRTIALTNEQEVSAVRLVFSGNSGAGGGQIAEAVLLPPVSEE